MTSHLKKKTIATVAASLATLLAVAAPVDASVSKSAGKTYSVAAPQKNSWEGLCRGDLSPKVQAQL